MSEPLSDDAILDAALAEIGDHGWSGFTLAAAATRLGVPLAQVVARLAHRNAVLPALLARTDRAMLDGITPQDEAESTRDRLFDLLMRRLDALAPHKGACKALAADLRRDPQAALALAGAGQRSMRLVAEAAGLPTHGLRGLAVVEGLVAVQAWTMRTWLRDDAPDQDHTLKALDKALAQACALLDKLSPCRVAPSREPDAAQADGEPVATQR